MDRPTIAEALRWLLVMPVAWLALWLSNSLLESVIEHARGNSGWFQLSGETYALMMNGLRPGAITFCFVHFGRLVAPRYPYTTALILSSFWLVVFLALLLLLASEGRVQSGTSPEFFSMVGMAFATFLASRAEKRKKIHGRGGGLGSS